MAVKLSIAEALEFGSNHIAEYYFERNKENLIYTNNFFYLWNGDMWKQYDDNSMILSVSNSLNDEI